MAKLLVLVFVLCMLVVALQFGKILSLNAKLHQQEERHDKIKKSLTEDVAFCEQHTSLHEDKLRREAEIKEVAEGKAADFERQLKETKTDLNLVLGEKEEAETHLKTANIKIGKLKKELKDIGGEIQKYHNLYLDGIKTLNYIRKKCGMEPIYPVVDVIKKRVNPPEEALLEIGEADEQKHDDKQNGSAVGSSGKQNGQKHEGSNLKIDKDDKNTIKEESKETQKEAENREVKKGVKEQDDYVNDENRDAAGQRIVQVEGVRRMNQDEHDNNMQGKAVR